jgi:hypothetical protein
MKSWMYLKIYSGDRSTIITILQEWVCYLMLLLSALVAFGALQGQKSLAGSTRFPFGSSP